MINLLWENKASDLLADIYVAATREEREVIALEVERLHRDLRKNPLDVGESRGAFNRVEMRGPLTFWFKVDDEATHVRIFHVSRRTDKH